MGAWNRTVELAVTPGLDRRSGFAEQALTAHAQVSGTGEVADRREAVVHLLADLMHLSTDLRADFSSLLTQAGHHYLEERLRS